MGFSKEDYFKKHGKDKFEYAKDQLVEFDFPAPNGNKRYYLITETPTASIEESYFWVLTYFQYDMSMPEIIKVNDIFGASEHSTFFNVAQQRIGLNQDKISQYLGAIGKMVKDMFQIVRELRILDERWEIYYKSKKMKNTQYSRNDTEIEWEKDRTPEVEDNYEITLKGLYVDMAEGASKNPSSVFGLAQQLQYTTLPDLFFSIHPANEHEVAKLVDKLEFNKELRWVLRRKLISYLKWKEHTYKEVLNRRKFSLKYLRQHYMVIKTYISWIKPHLRTISKLRQDQSKQESAELVSAFEQSLIEIEILGKGLMKGNKDVYTVVSSHWLYRTMPQMNYTAEGYQRAPLHIGEIKWQLRGYTWTQDEINDYIKLRDQEDWDMIKEVEGSLTNAMDALGDDIERYLEEAGEMMNNKPKPKENPKLPGLFDPFVSLVDGFANPFKSLVKSPASKKAKNNASSIKAQKTKAKSDPHWRMWLTYKNYKKSHKMVTW